MSRVAPTWEVELALALLAVAGKLISAATEEEREAAAMEATEATKAALDRAKFGG